MNITLGDLQHRCAAEFAQRPLLTMAQSGQTLSYAQFETLTNRFAHGLIDYFDAPIDYALILAENCPQYLAASYALKKINTIEVSINHAMKAAALARMIEQTKARLLITSATFLPELNRIRPALVHLDTLIMIDNPQSATSLFPEMAILSFDELLADCSDHITSPARDTDTATILFTSGTTGVSKGCLLSHRYAVRTAENMIEPFRISAEDCVYSPYPLSHIGPAYYDFLPTMMTGGHVILRERFSASNFWPEVNKYGVTWFMMLGSVQQLLWANSPSLEERSHKVTRCWGTPAPVPKPLFDKRFGLNLIPGGGYGSTDAGWVVVPQWNHPGGVVLPHFDIMIADEHDCPLPANEVGELLVRPLEPGVMSDGYFGMPERTLKSRRNLWFHTGDLGRIDEDGYFYFVSRISERIRVKGEMVSGHEVEEGLLSHPAIEDCAVIGVSGEMGEEDIKAFVVIKQDHSLNSAELRAHCTRKMAKYMVPKYIIFIDEMPRTSTGKPEKGKLALWSEPDCVTHAKSHGHQE